MAQDGEGKEQPNQRRKVNDEAGPVSPDSEIDSFHDVKGREFVGKITAASLSSRSRAQGESQDNCGPLRHERLVGGFFFGTQRGRERAAFCFA